MNNQKTFYITTTLPYLNAKPHVGFAMEIVRADVIARYKQLQGYDVFFNTGTDEHGQKIYQAALDAGQEMQAYVNSIAEEFKGLKEKLGLVDDVHFVRTTDSHHKIAAQEFWKRCADNGFIYKKAYTGLYCVGCELYITEKDLVEGKCQIHKKEPEHIEEENYFFKFSEFEKPLLKLYEDNSQFVIPDFRLREIQEFVKRGLEDFSISRLKEKMPWGVPVPNDDDHVMYVWFDALVNYISTLGWPENIENYEKFWIQGTPTQYAGKDNLRQQSAMWQAMLMAAKIPNSHQIVINGFINSGGQKMSKSLGNVINPYHLVDEYGTEALRYYLLRHLHPFDDSDMTMEKFKEVYNANLANGLGNLVSRIMKMVVSYDVSYDVKDFAALDIASFHGHHMDDFELQVAMDEIWRLIGDVDHFIAEHEPFKKVKVRPDEAHQDLRYCLEELYRIGVSLKVFLPTTSAHILSLIEKKQIPEQPLFIRI